MIQTKTKIKSPEAIRVAPLHFPKTEIKLENLGVNKEDKSLFDEGKGLLKPEVLLTYGGGHILANAEVVTIFMGKNWVTLPAFINLAKKINNYFDAITNSNFIDQLSEFSTPTFHIGHGSLAGSATIITHDTVSKISDTEIQGELMGWISSKVVPFYNENTVYFIYTDINVKITMGGGSSCSQFCGYHNEIGSKIFYAVIPFPSCPGCLDGQSVFNAITGTSSHLLSEVITDPVPGTGWYDEQYGEIGDVCPWRFKTVAGYTVQLIWSNLHKKCR